MGERTLHCWAEGPRTGDGCGRTCKLEAGHAGPHEWMRDDEIILEIAPELDTGAGSGDTLELLRELREAEAKWGWPGDPSGDGAAGDAADG